MSDPGIYCILSPLEIITDVDPLISPELRLFHQPTQQLQTISSNIEAGVSNDYVIVLPGNIPVVGQVLTAIDVATSGNSVTVHTGWTTVSSNSNSSSNVNVDVIGLYAANAINVPLNGTWVNVNSWVIDVTSPAVTLGSSTTLNANFPSKVNGSVKVGFQSLGSIGSRNVRVIHNGTPISLVTQQPNPNRNINTFVTVPFYAQLATNDKIWVQVQYSNTTTNGYPVSTIPGNLNTLMGISIVY